VCEISRVLSYRCPQGNAVCTILITAVTRTESNVAGHGGSAEHALCKRCTGIECREKARRIQLGEGHVPYEISGIMFSIYGSRVREGRDLHRGVLHIESHLVGEKQDDPRAHREDHEADNIQDAEYGAEKRNYR
jgi:hypothetical protein